jgi:cyclopropane-fatty-acyl-phospholipid synthase
MSAKDIVTSLVAEAGIEIDGPNPWDIEVHDDAFYQQVINQGALGFGESYMEGVWDCADMGQMFERVLQADIEKNFSIGWTVFWSRVKARLLNIQTIGQTRDLADTHYNLSNEFFEAMLGRTMAYSCAYWRDANSLDEAQENKLELICRKLQLGPGDRVLDIGCGWGSFAKYAARKYHCEVVGLTVAKEQATYAREFCAGLPVDIICRDYREFDMTRYGAAFDKIVSVGMVEHVGYRNYATFMRTAHQALKPRGLFLLHTIGAHKSSTHTTDPWFAKYIFPGGMFPSMQQLARSFESNFILEDLQNIGYDYGQTLEAWHRNFEEYWQTTDPRSSLTNFGGTSEVFYRMWRYYLLGAMANFRVRGVSVWQLVLAKEGVRGGYQSAR